MSRDRGEALTGRGMVVIALGNRFRGDDGVGYYLAQRLDGLPLDCAVIEGIEDALAIVSAWQDAALAVIIDAAASGAPPGTIHRLEAGAEPMPKDLARCSSHGLGLAEAVELSKVLGRLPPRLVIYAIEAKTFEPGAALSPEVAAAADEAVWHIVAEFAHA